MYSYSYCTLSTVLLWMFVVQGQANVTSQEDGCVKTFNSPKWLASIQAADFGNQTIFGRCVGTLINFRYVVTAAQCITDIRKEGFVPAVRVGDTLAASCYVWPPYGQHCLYYGVEAEIVHPRYNNHTGVHDLALLRLNSTVPPRSNIEPLSINSQSFSEFGRKLTVVDSTKTCTVRLISAKECNDLFETANATNSITENYICTTNWQNDTIDEDAEDDYSIGAGAAVTIRSEGEQLTAIINSRYISSNRGLPRVYTALSNYFSWIEENMLPWLPFGYTERCVTPDNTPGRCTFLNHCPELLEAFAVARRDKISYLLKFECSQDTSYELIQTSDQDYVVCCSTIQSTIIRSDQVGDLSKLSDRKYCGLQHRDDYISKNKGISIDEFPWIAQIAYDEFLAFTCSGTLINRRYVLTVAECVINAKTVRLGEFDRTNTTDCVELSIGNDCNRFQDFGIEEHIIHPFYQSLNSLNDIGLLRLDEMVEFTDYIRPICLPTPGTTFAKQGDVLYGTGWGDIPLTGQTRLKKKIKVSIISNKNCIRSLEGNVNMRSGLVDESKMCVIHSANTTEFLCLFDSGGPIMFSHRYQWHVEGVVAKTHYACESNFPTVLIRVSLYLPWIQENMRPTF